MQPLQKNNRHLSFFLADSFISWKSGRVAECVCFENRFTSNSNGGSNPSSSAWIILELIFGIDQAHYFAHLSLIPQKTGYLLFQQRRALVLKWFSPV